MELFLLDNLLRRTRIVDRFESLIWTERFKDIGDFELTIHTSHAHRSLFTVGSLWALNESQRVMMVDSVEKTKDADGRDMITITGPSVEQILEDRVAHDGLNGIDGNPNWPHTATPPEVARWVFKRMCIDGYLSALDKIPFIGVENKFPKDTIAEPTEVITLEMERPTVLEVIKQLCDIYGMGFRLTRDGDLSKLNFNIYMGSDRTTRQTTYTPVIFSPELDNLTDVTEIVSVAGYKNVAYVYSKFGAQMVYAQPDDATLSGFNRRVLQVEANDIELPAGTALNAALQQRGKEELAKHRRMMAFDGEISQTSKYKYGIHYQLGDIVEMRSADNASNNMRVSEQIFISDSSGERSYPTLTLDQFLAPGTWLSWDYNQVWNDAIGTWQEV